jgi:hypothetical protein
MVKNKVDIDTEKVPKKPHLEMKKPPVSAAVVTPSRPNATDMKKGSPKQHGSEDWEQIPKMDEANSAAFSKKSFNRNDLDDDEALLEASGLTFGSTSDDETNEAKIKMGRIGNFLVFRIEPGNRNKQLCYPDYKMYCLLQSFRKKDRPDLDLSWMKKYYFETSFGLWYDAQVAQLSYNKSYTTRLYVMAWKERISNQQAYLLGKVICGKVNKFRVKPDSDDRPDAPLCIDNDSEKLFWIEDGVWNDIISNSAALQRMQNDYNRAFTAANFEDNEAIIRQYFRKGTLDAHTAEAIGAPEDWKTGET